jgi:hypothetical protein
MARALERVVFAAISVAGAELGFADFGMRGLLSMRL